MPISTLFVAAQAMQQVLQQIKTDGTPKNAVETMLAFDEFTDLIGLPEVLELEQQFANDGM